MSKRHLVSVKGVISTEDGVILLKNDRDEWELPGGQLEQGERPEDCLAREIKEELCVDVVIGQLIDCWLFNPIPDAEVLIISYACRLCSSPEDLAISFEHSELGIFGLEQIRKMAIPGGYVRSIETALGHQSYPNR